MPIAPGGDLADYVPFYFTPYSPMLYNIKTGYGGIRQRPNQDIVILVSSLIKLEELGIPYVFTDRHAVLAAARFFSRLTDLSQVDFEILQRRDFRRDYNDPGKVERYTEEVRHEVEAATSSAGVRVVMRRDWYF